MRLQSWWGCTRAARPGLDERERERRAASDLPPLVQPRPKPMSGSADATVDYVRAAASPRHLSVHAVEVSGGYESGAAPSSCRA